MDDMATADMTTGDDRHAAIVSGLMFLSEHVQASISLIDSAIAREMTGGSTETNNVVVLDDVTPQYVKASHALNSCSASLDLALKSLLEGEAHQSAGQGQLRCIASKPSRGAK